MKDIIQIGKQLVSIPKFRDCGYTDEGCSLYQCLSCKNQWEGRSSPEYGWRFCPYCGVQWTGEIKGRPSHTPKWHWNLIDQLYKTQHPDYKTIQAREDHVERNRKSVDANLLVWLIEYFEKENWVFYESWSSLRNTTLPLHQAAHLRMTELRKNYEAERQEGIKDYLEDVDDNLKQFHQEMCDRIYPERKWRIRFMKKSELKKMYPSKYVF